MYIKAKYVEQEASTRTTHEHKKQLPYIHGQRVIVICNKVLCKYLLIVSSEGHVTKMLYNASVFFFLISVSFFFVASQWECGYYIFIVKIQNIFNFIGWNIVDLSDIFNCYPANTNGMCIRRKLGRICKTFELTLT